MTKCKFLTEYKNGNVKCWVFKGITKESCKTCEISDKYPKRKEITDRTKIQQYLREQFRS